MKIRFRASHLALGRQLLACGGSTEQDVKTNDAHSEISSLWHCPRCGASMIVIQRFTAMELSACRIAWADPSMMIQREPACGNDTVDVGMQEQVLSPSVEDGDDTDLGSQVLGIGCNVQ
jgi:hypothetical protein